MPVLFSFYQHRPENTGILVGHGHAGDIHASAGNQLLDPSAAPILLQGSPHGDGPPAMDQEGSQIDVAPFRNPQEIVLAATRMLAGYQAQLGGKLSPVPETGGVSD